MNRLMALRWIPLVTASSLLLAGCLNLKPVVDRNRYFLLTPASAVASGAPPLHQHQAVGIGRVEIPDYLRSREIAYRNGVTEIEYSPTLRWAERLDQGIQRVLAANVGSQMGSTNLVLSVWRRREVQAEIGVWIQSFESDESGRATLEARWRVTTPGGETVLLSNSVKISKPGPSFATDPAGAVATLSGLLGELSDELVAALRRSRSAEASSTPKPLSNRPGP